MPDLFISYSRRDKDFAAFLGASLAELGADVWLDVDDISAGEKWSEQIQRALDACRVMVVVMWPLPIGS